MLKNLLLLCISFCLSSVCLIADNLTMSDSVQTLRGDSFNEFINSDLAVVDFYSPSCGACRMMMPVFSEVASSLQNKASFGKINVKEERQISKENQINRLPTFIIYRNGREINRHQGSASAEELRNIILSSR